jgi:hypothetical protein
VRASFLGHALIGSSFAWSDFPYYAAGALAAAAGARWLCPRGLGALREPASGPALR